LLKTESERKSYDRFHLLFFFSWCKSGGAGLYTGRPVSGQRRRAIHRPVWRSYRGYTETRPKHVSGACPALAGLCTGRSGAETGETDF
jgi:hypothetical protein